MNIELEFFQAESQSKARFNPVLPQTSLINGKTIIQIVPNFELLRLTISGTLIAVKTDFKSYDHNCQKGTALGCPSCYLNKYEGKEQLFIPPFTKNVVIYRAIPNFNSYLETNYHAFQLYSTHMHNQLAEIEKINSGIYPIIRSYDTTNCQEILNKHFFKPIDD